MNEVSVCTDTSLTVDMLFTAGVSVEFLILSELRGGDNCSEFITFDGVCGLEVAFVPKLIGARPRGLLFLEC